MWYPDIEKITKNTPIISTVNSVGLVNNEIYVANAVFKYGDRIYITLHDHGDKKYGIKFFRNLTKEEEVKLRKLKIKSLLKNNEI